MASDFGWLERTLKDLIRRVYALEHPKLKPVRQTMLFSFSGQISVETGVSGAYPVFDAGAIFELWVSVQTPSTGSIGVIFSKYEEEGTSATTIGGITLPAGERVYRQTVNIPVTSGQRVCVIATPTPGETPATELTVAARLS